MVWYIVLGLLALWLILSVRRDLREARAECISKGGDGGPVESGFLAPFFVLLLGLVGMYGFFANEISGQLFPVVPTAWKTETSQLAIVIDHKRSAVTFCVLNEQRDGKVIGYSYLLGGTSDYRWTGLPDGGEVESVAITAARGSECLLTKTYATKWQFAPGYEWAEWFGRPNRMDHVRYEFKLPNGVAEGYEYN